MLIKIALIWLALIVAICAAWKWLRMRINEPIPEIDLEEIERLRLLQKGDNLLE